MAGGEYCAMHRVRAKNVGLVGLAGRLAQGAVCAMFPGIFKAHGSHASCAPVRIRPLPSVAVRIPLPAVSALRHVPRQPPTLLRQSHLNDRFQTQFLHIFCPPVHVILLEVMAFPRTADITIVFIHWQAAAERNCCADGSLPSLFWAPSIHQSK